MINTFEYLINTGVQSIEMIQEPDKKALACAELAKAIAMTGALKTEVATEAEVQEPVEEEAPKAKKAGKKSSKKDALKAEASKVEEPVEEPIEEEPVVPAEPVIPTEPEVPTASEPSTEIEAEWTERMCELKENELTILNSYIEAWGEDYVYNDCLGCFTEGAFKGGEHVLPTNIDGFVVYLNKLAEEFANQE